ncbi:MAG TPA: MFS transporter [Microvirga sp.]|nr:MFS transporter [Microvirga sp.]
MTPKPPDRKQPLAFILIAASTVLAIAGTDLVLPAVPSLPEVLGGSIERSQLVLAAYVLGTSVGLVSFGELGARHERSTLLSASLGLFALASLAAAFAPNIESLIAIRFAQGAFGAAPAVFAPGLIRALYGDANAVGALGRLGSIESLTPALAPIAGAYLLAVGGWQVSFLLLAALSVLVLVALRITGALLLPREGGAGNGTGTGGYGKLLRNGVFLRYALSQAFSLGSLLVFVFGAPAVLTGPLGLDLSAFIVLQVSGIAMFILGATLSGRLSAAFGAERLIGGGTLLLLAGFVALLLYAVLGGTSLPVVIGCFLMVNLGFGLRGPPGFHQAVVASEGDDARGAALVVLGVLVTAGLGTAAAAPFIAFGLVPLTAVATAVAVAACLTLAVLPARSGERTTSLKG